MSSLPLSPNLVRLNPSIEGEKMRVDHMTTWFHNAWEQKRITLMFSKEAFLVVDTEHGPDICKIGQLVGMRQDGSLYILKEDPTPVRYEVLITDVESGDPLLEGAIANAWGVDALIKQFCRQNTDLRTPMNYILEDTGELDVEGIAYHGVHFRLFAWTVKEDD